MHTRLSVAELEKLKSKLKKGADQPPKRKPSLEKEVLLI